MITNYNTMKEAGFDPFTQFAVNMEAMKKSFVLSNLRLHFPLGGLWSDLESLNGGIAT